MEDTTAHQADRRLAVRAGRAFDGQSAIPGGALVLCADGRIVGVEPGPVAAPDGWPVAEYPDGTVLPGMIDCHVHLCGDSRGGALDRLVGYSDEDLDRVIEAALRAQLAAGVTAVRDLGDRRWAVLSWRDRVTAGTVGFPSPAIVASGPPITTPGGHCWFMGGETGETSNPGALRSAIRERADRGVDIVKVMASGGVMTPGTDVLACQYTLEQLRTLVEEAHACGLPVTAHAHGLAAVVQAAQAGVDGIEHCSCLTERGIQHPADLLARLTANRTIVCPTLGIVPGIPLSPAVLALQERTGSSLAARQAMTGQLYQAGVRLVSGVDAGISDGKPHGILALAVADLVAGNIPAAGAIASATSLAADACGLGGRKGQLHPGYDADLLVVHGDPLADIGALTAVQAVYLGGRPVSERCG